MIGWRVRILVNELRILVKLGQLLQMNEKLNLIQMIEKLKLTTDDCKAEAVTSEISPKRPQEFLRKRME